MPFLGISWDIPTKTSASATSTAHPLCRKSVVIDPRFDWEGDKPPKIPYHKTIIYETHVKGFTKLHPDIPEKIRGTYAAIAHPVTIEYLKESWHYSY